MAYTRDTQISALRKRIRNVEVHLKNPQATIQDVPQQLLTDPLAELPPLKREAQQICDRAMDDLDWGTALAAVGEIRRIVELAAKLQGELAEVNQVNNVVQLQLDPETAERILQRYLASTESLNGGEK